MNVLGFEEALAEVLKHAQSHRRQQQNPKTETVPLLKAAGRVMAEPILADRDQPQFDRATRDGYAVRASELSSGHSLQVIGQVRAGESWFKPPMAADEAIEIMTGAPVPDGADAVVMIEHVEVSGAIVRSIGGRTLGPRDNIVLQGSEAHRGDVVVTAGSPMGAAEIAQTASCGVSEVRVYPKPTVAIVATGDELVELDQVPAAHQIRNSNSYALAAMVENAGAEPLRFDIARDTRDQLLDRIEVGRNSDLLLFSGGVSMGKFDLVEEVLLELGAEFFFTGVKMQPGKPLVFGRLPEKEGDDRGPERYFFGLPGNPVSTQVTFHCFVEPLLRALCGEDIAGPRFVQATLAEDIAGKPELTRVLPARLSYDLKQPTVRLVSWQSSGDLAANARANCYAVFPAEQSEFQAGDVISVLLR